ncbi:MAG: hypothetical protein P0111_03595 [Nitrospira sp.]|nr:hypothetical protein [Nitrospira sp.]
MAEPTNRTIKILVDYYDGAYGPTIRIDTKSMEELVKVKELLSRLTLTDKEIDISTSDLFTLKGVESLILKRVPPASNREKALERYNPDSLAFEWALASEGWERCVGLVEGLINHNSPAHQYLTREGFDDALIELAFQESAGD